MNRASLIFIILLLFIQNGYSQIADPGFAKYLKDNRSFDDLIILDQLDRGHLSQPEIDSLNFYTGWAHYNLQNLEKGIIKFSAVSQQSVFYNTSGYFAAWSELFLKNTERASSFIDIINSSTETEKELSSMFTTSIALINRDLPRADSLVKINLIEDPIYRPQWERMQLHYEKLNNYKPKSYGIAGVLSALVPGSGKIYAGQKGAGVSSFLSIGAMAAITIENMIKTGWTSWNSIAAASIFSGFYIGNIYGSVVGINIYRQRFNNEVDRAILLDINIPLRNIYR